MSLMNFLHIDFIRERRAHLWMSGVRAPMTRILCSSSTSTSSSSSAISLSTKQRWPHHLRPPEPLPGQQQQHRHWHQYQHQQNWLQHHDQHVHQPHWWRRRRQGGAAGCSSRRGGCPRTAWWCPAPRCSTATASAPAPAFRPLVRSPHAKETNSRHAKRKPVKP